MSLFERCATPGMKIRSKGKGMARGQGKGPIGEPTGEVEEDKTSLLGRAMTAYYVDLGDLSTEEAEEALAAAKDELAEDKDVTQAQKELDHLLQMLRTLAKKHTKRLEWAGSHHQDYQSAAQEAKRGLLGMVAALANLH